jgi:hypothetical protein
MPILSAGFLVFSGSACDSILLDATMPAHLDWAFECRKEAVRLKRSNPLLDATSRSLYLLFTFRPHFHPHYPIQEENQLC